MKLTDAQRKTLRRLMEGDCEYYHIMKVGGNGVTIACLAAKGLIEEYKVFGTRFWKITNEGRRVTK